jgi:hypothetical protein
MNAINIYELGAGPAGGPGVDIAASEPRTAAGGPRAGAKGSVLIVAMLLSVLIALALTSYINLALNSAKLADRSFYQNAAINLAEVGIEEAVFSYNLLDDVPLASPENAWEPYGWTLGADTAWRTLSGFDSGPGVTGEIKVFCTYFNPTLTQQAVVVAKSTLTLPSGPPLSKYVEVTLRRRALFPRGMVVRETIQADGGKLSLDSWDSMDDGDPSTPIIPYSTDPAIRRANATLATLSSAAGAIDIGNGNVFGYISTATGGTVDYGPTAVLSGDFAGTTVEIDRISHDFDVTAFPPVSVPPRTADWIDLPSSIGGTFTLPRAGDSPAGDGTYYYNFPIGTNVSSNNGTLRVTARVVLVLANHAGATAVNMGGSSLMELMAGGSLRVYSNGNITIGGGGLLNHNPEPSSCMLYGTHSTPGGQAITLHGNAATSLALFAPNANITISGGGSGGDFFGAIVGNRVRMTGTARFHYDEALARLVHTGNPYGIAKWRELQSAEERAAVAASLAF